MYFIFLFLASYEETDCSKFIGSFCKKQFSKKNSLTRHLKRFHEMQVNSISKFFNMLEYVFYQLLLYYFEGKSILIPLCKSNLNS